jgi:5'-methylthioadenosine phosphorylase
VLGIIGGTSLLFSRLPPLAPRRVDTPYGPAEVHCGEIALLLRHQRGLPPHRLNFRASLSALAILGVDRVVAIGSAGSLKREIPPGSLAIPADFLTWEQSPSVHDHAISHVLPSLDPGLADDLGKIVPGAHRGGTYAQTGGPRIETLAEVRALARVADLVGMTLASEASLACELGIPYTALCTVDNYAHGIGGEAPTYEHILDASRAHADRTGAIVEKIIGVMG